MLVDIGEVKRHIKPKADSTLYNMRKADLIEYIRTLEHNYNVAVSFNENQVKYIESLNVQQWIPVSERLPEKYQRVLVCLESKLTVVARLLGGQWVVSWNNAPCLGVTHWMPLPEPPK